MFEAESLGLSAMYATQSIRVPMPYKVVSLCPYPFLFLKCL